MALQQISGKLPEQSESKSVEVAILQDAEYRVIRLGETKNGSAATFVIPGPKGEAIFADVFAESGIKALRAALPVGLTGTLSGTLVSRPWTDRKGLVQPGYRIRLSAPIKKDAESFKAAQNRDAFLGIVEDDPDEADEA